MMAGRDETFQLATDLDPQRAGVFSMQQQPPGALANAAADWLEREMSRPIERYEWNRPTFRHRLWLHADTGEGLVESDSENKARADLGPPDRVVAVSTYRRRAVSAASIERIRRAFPPSEVEAAITTLARTEPGDDDLIHRILLRVSRGDLVALKRATWVAVRDWRDVVFAARNLDLEDEEPASDGAEPPAPRSSSSPALARELVAAAESLRWAETLASSVEAGEVYVDHGDRAAELEVVGRHCDNAGVWIDAPAIFIVYRGVELPVPEEEYCVDVTIAIALATGWVRDGRHPDLDE